MTGTEVHDRGCDDHVRTDLRTVVGLVLPAAEFAFDPDVRALLEAHGIFGQLGPSLDAVPFGPFLALIVLDPGRLGRKGESGDGFATRGIGGFRLAAEKKSWPRAATADDEKEGDLEKLSHNEWTKEKRP